MLKDADRKMTMGPFQAKDATEVTLEIRMHKIGQQAAYFSATYNRVHIRSKEWDSFGAGVEHVLKDITEPLPPKVQFLRDRCLRWHLTHVDSGPMHYAPNAQYWWRNYLRSLDLLPRYIGKKVITDIYDKCYNKDPLGGFKTTVVFGCIEGDELPSLEFPKHPRPSQAEQYVLDDWEKRMNAAVTFERAEIDKIIHDWTGARFEKVKEAFERDMVELWGQDVLV